MAKLAQFNMGLFAYITCEPVILFNFYSHCSDALLACPSAVTDIRHYVRVHGSPLRGTGESQSNYFSVTFQTKIVPRDLGTGAIEGSGTNVLSLC